MINTMRRSIKWIGWFNLRGFWITDDYGNLVYIGRTLFIHGAYNDY